MSQAANAITPAPQPLESLGAILKAAGDPLRLAILRVLARGSYGVLELCRVLDVKQSALSHHLKVLAGAELVATRREGNSIYYRRALPPAGSAYRELYQALYRTVDGTPLPEAIQQQLVLVQEERAQASRDFFAANAHKFREQQDLIASHPVYGEPVADLLNHLPLLRWHSALEVGPGEGEFLPALSHGFRRVIALDNSLNMLNRAQTLAAKQQLTNVEFVLGDTRTAVERELHVDCVVINMVLHHVPSPGDIFQDIAQLLNPSGVLLVTELCRHDQQWATESCGDLWLGFDPQDLTDWAEAAGLESGQPTFFGLRNGFQVQLHSFYQPDKG